jgi:anti-anti-sigma regulatory factor
MTAASLPDPHQHRPLQSAPEDQYPLTDDGVLKVYCAGPTTVLGFAGSDVPSEFNVAHYRSAITDLLVAQHATVVAFDLTGVSMLPSGMLGLLVSLARQPDNPPRVQVFNACADVREVLAITRLDSLVEVCDVSQNN